MIGYCKPKRQWQPHGDTRRERGGAPQLYFAGTFPTHGIPQLKNRRSHLRFIILFEDFRRRGGRGVIHRGKRSIFY